MLSFNRPLSSLPDLIAWLRVQDPKAKYNPHNSIDCLLVRFVKDQGYERVSADYTDLQYRGFFGRRAHVKIPTYMNEIAGLDGRVVDNTFGAALARATEYAEAANHG